MKSLELEQATKEVVDILISYSKLTGWRKLYYEILIFGHKVKIKEVKSNGVQIETIGLFSINFYNLESQKRNTKS